MTTTTETTTVPEPAAGKVDRQARIIAKALRKKTFATLATVSPQGRSHSAGVVYDFVDGALWIHTMREGRKGRNVAHNCHVGVCVPYRRLPVGPPYTLHFQGVAELVRLDDPEAVSHYQAGRLDSISGHGAMQMDGACFVRITPTGTIHSFGPGVPVLDLVRNPLETGARSAPAAAVLAQI
ncbi:MAG: pyridoxamine 5'-phosphate oxidase family protein [Acidimicrobiia bacterium]|nr:pyridoxamine 5'-phosphate oxidase family protein [Acidimicrobiia bacterium]